MKQLLFLLITLSLMACANKKNSQSDVQATTGNQTPQQQLELTKPVSESDTLVGSLEKTACFGQCPTFVFSIYASGYVRYEGTRNVDMLGIHEGRISQAQFNRLLQIADSINYFSMDKNYDDPMITDLPSTISSIVKQGERQTVRRRAQYPQTILILEKKYLELIEAIQWTEKRSTED